MYESMHQPCPDCGSSDALSVFRDGHTFCFACQTWKGGNTKIETKDPNLLEVTSFTKTNRGIHLETLSKFSYNRGSYKGAAVHVAPYFSNGKIVAQHLRTADKEFYWVGDTKTLELFGQNKWQTGGARLVITEGEIDAMSVAQVFNLKWPVVSVPSGAQSAVKYIKQNLEFVESFQEVVLAFDNDEPGRQATEKVASILTPGKVKVVDWSPYKDANDWLQAGKHQEIATKIFQAKTFRPDGIIDGADVDLETLMQQASVPISYSLPYPDLDDKLKGIRKGELTMFTAGSGIGKSTVVREIAYHLRKEHGLKVGYIALEESKDKTVIGFIALDNDVPLGDLFLDRSLLTEDQWKDSYDRLIRTGFCLYDHFGSVDSENLLSKLKYMSVGLGCDFLVVDHISIIVSGMEGDDERKRIDVLMTNLRSLIEQTGVGCLAITHLRQPEGKSHEEGGQVSLNQLRGSGSLKQLSDNVVGLERDQQSEDPNVSQIRLLKNRLFGITGLCDSLRYNTTTGRLLPDYGLEPSGGIDEDHPF